MANIVEICANCGKISKEDNDDFLCTYCGSNISVNIPKTMFKQLVESGKARE